jgi:eukaryotic-like serine/threonine-protein kinase
MEGVLAILMVFGMPVVITYIVKSYRFREKELALKEKQQERQLLLGTNEDLDKQRKALEARIQNLETIVCSVDYELNVRLNRLAAEQSRRQLHMPAGAAAPDSPAAGGTRAEQLVVKAAGPAMEGLLKPGQKVLDRFTVERELGRGGFGAVYLAHDAKLGERVALKTIASYLVGDPAEVRDRLRLEVQAARKITHANVIRIHDLAEDGALLFLSMEFIDGQTLHARVKDKGPPGIPEAREILGAVAAGVAAAHEAGIVHRDIKPQNVLIGPRREVKVIDFGLAKTSFSTQMTATGLIMGTPEYMAPEQIRGGRCDARTDVYQLGVLAYFVLTGKPPFQGDTPIAVGFAQVHDTPAPLRPVRSEIPAELERVVLKAMSKNPQDRYADAAALREAILG